MTDFRQLATFSVLFALGCAPGLESERRASPSGKTDAPPIVAGQSCGDATELTVADSGQAFWLDGGAQPQATRCLPKNRGPVGVFRYVASSTGFLVAHTWDIYTANGSDPEQQVGLAARTRCDDLSSETSCTLYAHEGPGEYWTDELVTPIVAGEAIYLRIQGENVEHGTGAVHLYFDEVVPGALGQRCEISAPIGTRCAAGLTCVHDGATGYACQDIADEGCGVGIPVVDLTPLMSGTHLRIETDITYERDVLRSGCDTFHGDTGGVERVYKLTIPDLGYSPQLAVGMSDVKGPLQSYQTVSLRTTCSPAQSTQRCSGIDVNGSPDYSDDTTYAKGTVVFITAGSDWSTHRGAFALDVALSDAPGAPAILPR